MSEKAPGFQRINFTQMVAVLAGIDLVWRLIFLPASQSSYTDGLLQIDLFRRGLTYWPPLYALLARLPAWIPGLDLEASARLVSIAAGTAALVPTGYIARRLFGERAALFAMIAYLISPLPLRWSLQVMTDTTFLALWMGTLACAVSAAVSLWPDHFNQPGQKFKQDFQRGSQMLMLAGVLGTLATLTRYQGIFLAPIVGAMVALAMRKLRMGKAEVKPRIPLWASLLPWLAAPLWVLREGFTPIQVHLAQMGGRAAATTSAGQTAVLYFYFFESFLIVLPYFLTIGIFAFGVYGLARTQFATRRIRWSLAAGLYLSLALLVLHSLFLAYQERYLLPVVPFACVLAGHGIAVWQKRQQERPWWFWSLAGLTFAYAAIFSALVAFHQGSPFLDIKKAGQFLEETAQEEAEIFANEVYNQAIGAAKLEYWSGREKVHFLGGEVQPRPGDYIVLSSVYSGWQLYQAQKRALLESIPTTAVATFANVSYPLLPDIMEEPGTHVSPAAWPLRYFQQKFETTIFQVTGPGGAVRGAPGGEVEGAGVGEGAGAREAADGSAGVEAGTEAELEGPDTAQDGPLSDPRWQGPEGPSEELQVEIRAAERAAEVVERVRGGGRTEAPAEEE